MTAIYLDHNATTPLLPGVLEAMNRSYSTPQLNPASQHEFGRRARRVLEDAKDRIAELLGAKTGGRAADRLILTSGGTEANNLAIFGTVGGRNAPPGRIIVPEFEHPSITAAANYLKRCGWQIDHLGVDGRGVVHLDDLDDRLRPATRLATVLLGHNETGVLQPVGELAARCHRQGIPVHTDAAQVVGKMPVDFRQLGVATLSLAAHKFHGPPGIGVLLVRHDVSLAADLYGGPQQQGFRPGSEPVTLAVGMCRALELWHAERDRRQSRMQQLRDRFESSLLEGWPAAVVLGRDAPRLPHTSNVAFVGIDRQAMFMALDQARVACSTGSACASGSSQLSPAHEAMRCPKQVANSALRFSLGATTTAGEVDEAVRRILAVAHKLRRPPKD